MMRAAAWVGMALVFSSVARGRVALYVPQVCAPTGLGVEAKNETDAVQAFWILVRGPGSTREYEVKVPPSSTRFLPAREFLTAGEAFWIRQDEPTLVFHGLCGEERLRMSSPTAPRLDFPLFPLRPGAELTLRLQNLHGAKQTVRLQFRTAGGRILKEQTVLLDKTYVSLERRLAIPLWAATLRIEGEARLSAAMVDAGFPWSLPARILAPARIHVSSASTYFLLSDGDESFIAATADPKLTQEARELIRTGTPRILFAEIEPAGSSRDNRDLLTLGAPPWSWRVKRILGFGDLGSIDCSGSPSFVEDYLPEWLSGPRVICFWNFHLQHELTAAEVETGTVRRPLPVMAPVMASGWTHPVPLSPPQKQ